MREEVQLNARIPTELKALVDADSRANREVVTAALWREFGGKRDAAVDVQLQHKRERASSVRAEMDSLGEELARYEHTIEKLEEARAEREDMIGNVLTEAAEVFEPHEINPDHEGIRHWADKTDLSPREFAKRLQERLSDD